MDKYDKLMQEIVEFLRRTPFSRSNPHLMDRGPICGCTDTEIDNAEQEIGKTLPYALRAWYRAGGKVPPYINDYDADYSLNDLKAAQPAARYLERTKYSGLKLNENIIPISQRIGEQINYVDLNGADPSDPPVFHYHEDDEQPAKIAVAFTAFIRDLYLSDLNLTVTLHGGFIWNHEAQNLREGFIEKVHQEDLTKNTSTGPREFQKRWVQFFSTSEMGQQILREAQGRFVPYYWIDIPK